MTKLACASCGIQELAAEKPAGVPRQSLKEYNWKRVHLDAFLFQFNKLARLGSNYLIYNGQKYHLIESLVTNNQFHLSFQPDPM